MILKGSMGLGDAIYLYPVVKYYAEKYPQKVTIITRYPQIYANLDCKTVKEDEFIDCQCSARTKEANTNIFEDTLIMAQIKEKLPFELEYTPNNDIKIKTDKKICIIRNLTVPVKGDDSAKTMVPNIEVYQNIISKFKDSVYFITIGWQKNCDFLLKNIDMDLSAISDLRNYISIIDNADIVLTQPGHCVPLAEALNKKLFCIFARSGLESMEKRYRFTTPEKILTKKTSSYCIDDELPEIYLNEFQKLLEL